MNLPERAQSSSAAEVRGLIAMTTPLKSSPSRAGKAFSLPEKIFEILSLSRRGNLEGRPQLITTN